MYLGQSATQESRSSLQSQKSLPHSGPEPQSVAHDEGVSPRSHESSPQDTAPEEPPLPPVPAPLEPPAPADTTQSAPQLALFSPPTQAWSPHQPQSAGHPAVVSGTPQSPSPHEWQSAEHVYADSEALHTESPHLEQSAGQFAEVSTLEHVPSPHTEPLACRQSSSQASGLSSSSAQTPSPHRPQSAAQVDTDSGTEQAPSPQLCPGLITISLRQDNDVTSKRTAACHRAGDMAMTQAVQDSLPKHGPSTLSRPDRDQGACDVGRSPREAFSQLLELLSRLACNYVPSPAGVPIP
jgi:hypothetical protein